LKTLSTLTRSVWWHPHFKEIGLNSTILKVAGFSKSFRLHEQGKTIPASSNVNLEVHQGKLTALIGPTGAGKSSVLKGIYRTYLPSTGKIIYHRENGLQIDLVQADEQTMLDLRRDEIGFVTQFLFCLPRMATLDVVAQPLYARGIAREESQQRAVEMLRQMDLPERLWSISPATFSGGEKQRVNLARGLVSRPRLLLLDEPTASLDPATSDRVVSIIEDIKNEGVGMLAIFHSPDLTQRLADHVVELAPPVISTESQVKEYA
jgi:alpha-D-ribose 1-methylphosphonate 5-triphosphate synthase subunit PhnL